MKGKILAFVCVICPFCIVKRRYPKSYYAKVMRKIEKYCPFCLAYNRLYNQETLRISNQ